MTNWYVPGSALPSGTGWCVWVSAVGAVQPPVPTVLREGATVASKITTAWSVVPGPAVSRKVGILTITLEDPAPGMLHTVVLEDAAGVSQRFRWRAMPSALSETPVSFLLASCFYWPSDKGGEYAAEMTRLVKKTAPIFKLLMGDQVYQDVPLGSPGGGSALESYFARYEQYWSQPEYRAVLNGCPTFFVSDDHEFWNNSPEWQPHLSRTHGPLARRQEYLRAGAALFDLYQGAGNPGRRRWFSFELSPVSFFVADTRSERTLAQAPNPGFFSAEQWKALGAWVHELTGPGILILGQPFFQASGDWKDYALCDFTADYARLCDLIVASHTGRNRQGQPHHILILSGDIHCCRLARGMVAGATEKFREIHEFITSPASLLKSSIGMSTVEKPPGRISSDGTLLFDEITIVTDDRKGGLAASIHNNVGHVALSLGGDGSVRAELEVYCVRPYNEVPFWSWGVDQSAFPRPGQLLFHRTIQLK